MKIALAQINTQIGAFEENFKQILHFWEKGRESGADWIVFPELTLTGYSPKDYLERTDFVEKNIEVLNRLVQKISDPGILVGFVEPSQKKEGPPLFNSVAVIRNHRIISTHQKSLLPNYDVFDEKRYFQEKEEVSLFESDSFKIAPSICEDIWSEQKLDGRVHYSFHPILLQSELHPKVFVNLSASPYEIGKPSKRDRILSAWAKRFKTPMIYTNLVGGNDELIFDGQSAVFDTNGEKICSLKAFEEDFAVVDLNQIQSKKNIFYPPLHKWEETKKGLISGIRDYCQKTGFKKLLIGLSGGIDSALIAVLAAEAVGASNVLGISIPSRFSSKGSIDDAQKLAKSLQIEHRTLPLDSIFQNYLTLFGWKAEKEVDLSAQNLQSRIRGTILMGISNHEGRLLLSTGNKSEIAVGYCTLYGDMNGALCPIGDLYKTEVYELARWINQEKEIIPEETILKPPSAELAPGQTDQDDLPPYEILDSILKLYLEERKSAEEIERVTNFDKELIHKTLKKVWRNEYKRWQGAPILKLSCKSFGTGRRIPLTASENSF